MAIFCASPAFATIIAGAITGGSAVPAGGAFVNLTPFVGTVGNDNFQNPNFYGFDETQNIVLAAPLTVDIFAATYAAILPIGLDLASHYVFFDPNPGTSLLGTVDFDSDVVAIITSTGLLAASDFLVSPVVTYLNPGARGLEGNDVAA